MALTGVLLTVPGSGLMRYGQLTATDARGRTLSAQFAVEGSTIRIAVDDRGAVYPLVVDPLVQQGNKLTGSGESGSGEFGHAVALSRDGTTALVGAYRDTSNVGAAFVFTRSLAATATAGSPQSVPIGAPFAPLTLTLTLTLTDSGFGTPVSNTVLTFTAPTLTANATAGNDVVSVSADGETIPVFSLVNTPGGAATIIASTGGGQTATIGTVFLTTFSTVVMDLHPNPVPGVAVSFVVPDTGASGTFGGNTTVTTDSNGVAIAPAFTATTRAGSYTVSATAVGVGVPTTFSLTNTPATTLAFTGFPAAVVAGLPPSFTLTARDVGGNVATAYTGAVSFARTNTAADQGAHVFTATLLTVGTGRGITATDRVTAAITGTQSGIAVTPPSRSPALV